ncbi:MAG: tocopherol cyclase family protein [bacterium]
MAKPRMHDYAVRWVPGDEKGHVESFFLKANDPGSDRAFWLKFTIYSPLGGTPTVGEVWAILFDEAGGGHVAAKETYPISETTQGPDGIGVVMKSSRLDPGRTTGSIRTDDGTEVAWDLTYEPDRCPLYLFPAAWMYTAPFPKSKTLTPTADTRFTGTISAGKRRFEVQQWPGMQGHNWGRSHAERYAWAHCNLFDTDSGTGAEGAIFEGLSGKIKVGPMTTPFLTLAILVHRGITYGFTDISCWLRASSAVEYTAWDFICRKGRTRLIGSFWTNSEQMVGLTYRNPNGDVTHCLNSKIAHCELRLVEAGATRIHLRSAGKAALEVAVKEPDHGIRMHV